MMTEKLFRSTPARVATFFSVLALAAWLGASGAAAQPAQTPPGEIPAAGVPALPKWSLVPRTATSVPLGTVVVEDTPALKNAPRENAVPLDKYGYVEEEYIISGTANLYAPDSTKAAFGAYGFGEGQAVAKANVPYTTRILVRRPADIRKFSGTVQLEPIRDVTEWATTWEWTWPYMVATGDVWVGFTMSKDNIEKMHKKFDPARYAALDIPDEGLRWDIMAQVAWLMRSPDGPLGKLGFLDKAAILPGVMRVYSSGWSLTGCMQEEFINKGHHARARRPDGHPVIDGYVVGICPVGGKVDVPNDAAVMQVMSESEYRTSPDRPNNVAAVREPDATKAGEARYRWYDVAGVSHAGYLDQPQFSLTSYQMGMTKDVTIACANPVSRLPGMNDFARAVFRNLDEWVRIGRYPPRGKQFQLNDDHTIKRDEYGNAEGGIRAYWVAAPDSAFVPTTAESPDTKPNPVTHAVGGFCPVIGHEEPFSKEQFAKLYKDPPDYVSKVTDAEIQLVNDRYLLATDADAELATVGKAKTP